MPLYDYDCAACGRRFEVIHGVHDPSPKRCPLCGEGPVRKAFTAPAVHFKGSGWAKKERRAAVKSHGSSSDDGDTGEKGEKRDLGDKGDKGGKAGGTKPAEGTSSTAADPSTSTSTSSTKDD